MKHHFQLRQTLTCDKPPRYSANGKKISKATYDEIFQRGNMHGEVDCFATTCKQIGEGRFRRVNFVSVRY